ncbi:MAG: DUF3365 domain-containing protein [Syntrophaceae bacterium]|nr:DUF3365 domain-containing protein [Syntrophaceae bacterium]
MAIKRSAMGGLGGRWSLQTKFCVGIVLLLALFTSLMSFGMYMQLTDSMYNSVYEKSEIILGELEATRKYVASILRPRVSSLVSQDEFVLEAMSTAYVSREIMGTFQKMFPDFTYKRAALNPREPRNQADAFEQEIISRFQKDRSLKEWHGIVTRDDQRFFVRMVPIKTENACLRCHGEPDDAPAKLISLYGPQNGFKRNPDEISGLDVLSFPVESAMDQIWRQAMGLLGPGLLAIIASMIMVIALFRSLVVNRIEKVKNFFADFVSDGGDLSRRIEFKQKDEIGELCRSFNTMADRLNGIMEERDELLVESDRQRQKMASIFDGITDKLMLISPDKSVIMANAASLEGITEKTENLKCFQLIHGMSEACPGCLLQQALNEKVPIFGEVCQDNKEVYLAHFYPIISKTDGSVESVVHYCKSITEKKRLEESMVQAEKLASLGQLVAGVAHELNNPLGLVLFYAELIKKELPPGSEHLMDLEVIEKHTRICKTVVRDLLKFAGSSRSVPIPGNLNESIEEVVSVLEKQFSKDGIKIDRNFDPGIPLIDFDRNRLKQVWMNLLLNSRQAITTSDGRITVSTSIVRDTGAVHVTVSDNGLGIPYDIQRKIFDPFFTTKKTGEGTGLGLSVSYGIVREHGGEIIVESQPGRGSTFTVILNERTGILTYG